MMLDISYDLIVTVVNKGWSAQVIEVAAAAGARGATVLHGRGSGSPNLPHMFGVPIEPEKEIILSAVPAAISARVLTAIDQALDLRAPGKGIAMMLSLKDAIGLVSGGPEKQ